MAVLLSTITSSSLIPARLVTQNHHNLQPLFHNPILPRNASKIRISFRVQAAKLPAGVEVPKVEPKFNPPFLGFTKTAEIWNSRACMIGLIGTFIVELILNKGILQVIGVDVGKGLDIPL
ncbi:light-harvesting complex-like protein OHP1, chloroplastic [Ziziphus jujuba]|uniref:Light-harvesting complex-like protein OHP1, chloroplastic n=1 Tax=Ziziphus jujuba TaxID=326968 RepID=A0ABM4ACF1_ZIZJJ|nr:light-harvesting complex-like protein OHP1, chloroplastic [Ziziphus jujuba]